MWRTIVVLVMGVMMVQSVAAVEMFSQYEGIGTNMTLGIPENGWFRVLGEDNITELPVTFFMLGNDSVVIDGRIGQFHDSMVLINKTWKDVQKNIVIYASGTYNIMWGVNLTNGSVFNDSFLIYATGNDSAVNESGVNESDIAAGSRRLRYGVGQGVVSQRLANKTKVVVANSTGPENTTAKNVMTRNMTMFRTSVENASVVLVPSPVVPVTPIQQIPVVESNMSNMSWIVPPVSVPVSMNISKTIVRDGVKMRMVEEIGALYGMMMVLFVILVFILLRVE